MFTEINKWLEFVKFSHTVFALPFALASMLIAARYDGGWPGWRTFLLILVAMVCARSCAMAFNRIADRDIDGLNPRTSLRHLPAGTISLTSAWTLCALSAVGLMVSAWFLNPLCFYLSPVAIAMVCFYSYTKRFTDFTHVFLGLALALAPIGAWIAVRGSFSFVPDIPGSTLPPIRDGALVPLILGAAVVFWLVGFDVIYAIQDYEFDKQHGLHSLVVRWGPRNALRMALICHVSMMMCLGVLGLICRFRMAYFGALGVMLLSLLFEHLLARLRSLNWVQNAFFRLNALISLVYLMGTLIEVLFPNFRMVR